MSNHLRKKKIEVQGLQIRIEAINDDDYISLTDIAKQSAEMRPAVTIQSWLRNSNTILFLDTWEKVHNQNYKVSQMTDFLLKASDNRKSITPKKWIEITNAIGFRVKSGRGGGAFAHKDIAINFCYWLSPPFQVYFIKEFQRLKEEESERKNLEWHVSKLTDNVEEMRNLLDTIPGQKPERDRLKGK